MDYNGITMQTARSFSMIRVLLVDDQPAVLQGLRMRMALEADLNVVGVAGDGQQAISVAKACEPDVVVMDVEMPIMDGIAATAKIHGLLPETAVIMLSIHDNPQLRNKAKSAGAAAYVEKSEGINALLEEIRNCAG
jgi:DNA-binding NarL/FixJ family response regulator